MKNYRLYLVRHGITQGNLRGIYMGSGTDEPLCEQGIAQLRELREAFPFPRVATVFSSPLKRALGSAEILFPRSHEQDHPAGSARGGLRRSLRAVRCRSCCRTSTSGCGWTPPAHYTPKGGENTKEFHSRCSRVLMGMFEYMMKSGIDEAACVTHGGVIVSMLAQRGIPKYPPEHWMARRGRRLRAAHQPRVLDARRRGRSCGHHPLRLSRRKAAGVRSHSSSVRTEF